MIKITFDNERSLEVSQVFWHPLNNRLSGNRNIAVTKESDIPDISDFVANPNFTTLEVVDEETGVAIPVGKGLDYIIDVAIEYYAHDNSATLTVALGKEEQ